MTRRNLHGHHRPFEDKGCAVYQFDYGDDGLYYDSRQWNAGTIHRSPRDVG